jgi:hypothetical protein
MFDFAGLRAAVEKLRSENAGNVQPGIPIERRRGMDAAFERVLALIDGQVSASSDSSPDLDARIEKLREQGGWVVVHNQLSHIEPVPGVEGIFEVKEGSARLERLWQGRAHSVVADNLEAAVVACELEQARIEQLDNRPTPTTSGLRAR